MNEWELTDDEIFHAANPNILPHYSKHISEADRAIANAAVKKAGEFLSSHNQAPKFFGSAHYIHEDDLLLYFQSWGDFQQGVGL